MIRTKLREKELYTKVKAQFFHDCLTASIKNEPADDEATSFAIDWDSFEKHFNAQNIFVSETVSITSHKLIGALNSVKLLGKKLKSKKVAARLLSS